MKNACFLLLVSTLTFVMLCEPSMADKRQGHRNRNQGNNLAADQAPLAACAMAQGGAANAAQAQAQRQAQATQAAQIMLTRYDQNGDGVLNLEELQTGLAALFQFMSANAARGQTSVFGANQLRAPQGAGAQLQNGGAAAGHGLRGGGGRKGGGH